MLNEFVYCPRLFYYEWVEGVFANNRETVEGSLRHAKLDAREDALPAPEDLAELGAPVATRSITLSSDTHGLIAKMDVIEAEAGRVTPVDYKRGSPWRGDDGRLEMWDTDRIQLGVQALVLRENGYTCDEAIVFYVTTRQRVRLAVDDALIGEVLQALADARRTAASGCIPPPLVDSPKCPRCSLVGICLPDETDACSSSKAGVMDQIRHQGTLFEIDTVPQVTVASADAEPVQVRRLLPARDDLRPLYLNQQGLSVGKSAGVLKVKEKRKVIQEVRIGEICQLNLFGNVQLTTQAVQSLCQAEVPIAYFSQGGWFYGVTQGLGVRNIYTRKQQFRWAESPTFCLRLSRALVAGKIRNQRTMLQRNHLEPPRSALAQMKCMEEDAALAPSLDVLLGIEGNAARVYFSHFSGLLKVADGSTGDEHAPQQAFTFDFTRRNRRPPRDAVNALLSLAYSVLSKDLTICCHTVGLDPFLGFFHQPRFGRASLALDLMEPFRPLIADSAVLTAINTRMVSPQHFVRAGEAVALRPEGRKAFFRAFEQRMDTLVTHPLFGYRISYRRLLEVQTRLLARVLTGEMDTYPVFTTR